ncbi:MAG: AraC family transcriptional regulator, partial [Acidobacteria bacterium]|nr:AraC family transcriptional regulator [Acidobacteriota bacterium]
MSTVSTATGCRDCTLESRYRTVERVILKMRERLDEPFSLQEMAKIAYLSPFHFNRVF